MTGCTVSLNNCFTRTESIVIASQSYNILQKNNHKTNIVVAGKSYAMKKYFVGQV